MVKSEHKRQQKLARKQAKDRKRRTEIAQVRHQSSSLHGQMVLGATGSVAYCGISPSLKSDGIGSVVLARRCANGQLAYFCTMLDIYCLGVKDAFGGLCTLDKLRFLCEKAHTQPASIELARGLVEAAIEFAGRVGLRPHEDYRNVSLLWGDTQAASIEGEYELGKDGQHFYIPGPFDDLAKQMSIIKTLGANSSGQAPVDHITVQRLEVDD